MILAIRDKEHSLEKTKKGSCNREKADTNLRAPRGTRSSKRERGRERERRRAAAAAHGRDVHDSGPGVRGREAGGGAGALAAAAASRGAELRPAER